VSQSLKDSDSLIRTQSLKQNSQLPGNHSLKDYMYTSIIGNQSLNKSHSVINNESHSVVNSQSHKECNSDIGNQSLKQSSSVLDNHKQCNSLIRSHSLKHSNSYIKSSHLLVYTNEETRKTINISQLVMVLVII
jgi:hypothetical protein